MPDDLLRRFEEGAELVRAAAAWITADNLDTAPAPGKWSPRQILCHLADSEMVGRDRIMRVAAEDNPTIICYDQDAWAAKLDYAVRDPTEALESFCSTRASNARLLRALPEDAWTRIGTHSTMGQLTLIELVRIYAEHAQSHARQLRAAVGA
jgi:hypothetical protein